MYNTCIVIFAHNEENTIVDCLNSLPVERSDITIHVIVNGSTDNTAKTARSFVNKYENVVVHDWLEGGKSHSWNRFVFKTLTEFSDTHIFVDGDVVVKKGSIDALVDVLMQDNYINAAAGIPLNGRNVEYYQQEMIRNHGLFGGLYALKGRFLKKMKASNICLPDDLIGDDGLIGSLVKCDLKNEKFWDNKRLIVCSTAGFYCKTFNALDIKNWASQYNRMINYSVRHFQNKIISDIMKSDGANSLPQKMALLYIRYRKNFKPRKTFPHFWFDILAYRKMVRNL